MRRPTKTLAMVVALAACGEVKGNEPDAAPPEPDADTSIDATVAPEPCNGLDDDGDGAIDEGWAGSFAQGFADSLPAWDVVAFSGNVPNVFERKRAGVTEVANGALVIGDAAVSPSQQAGRNNASWIYELNIDRGNQLAHPVAIGTADFAMTVAYTMKTSMAEGMLAGVALTNERHFIEVMTAAYDPTVNSDYSDAQVWIRKHEPAIEKGIRLSPSTPHASYLVGMSRAGDELTIEGRMTAGDGPVDAAAAPSVREVRTLDADIRQVALVGVRLGTAPFGTFTVRQLAVCWKQPRP